MPHRTRPPWLPRDIIYSFILSFFLFNLVDIVIVKSSLVAILKNSPHQAIISIGLYLLQTIIILIPLYFFTVRKYGSRLKDFGLKKIKTKELLKIVAKAYLLWIYLNFLIAAVLFSAGLENFPGYHGQEPVIPAFGAGITAVLSTFFVAVLIAPVVEEIFFRGFILQTLLKKFRLEIASILSAALFALFHFQLQSIIPLFLIGLIINWIFLRSRSLWPCIVFHALNNAVALLVEIYLR